jgi:recombinational DNA repair protein RecR
MGNCCGRPNNRASKNGAAGYHQTRYAYLSSHQIEQAEKVIGQMGKCNSCDALTLGDPCTICGNPKTSKEEQE